jgi:tetratricopeptide (TPR) repeat protein
MDPDWYYRRHLLLWKWWSMKYRDFVLFLTSDREGYRVQVVRSPAGTGGAPFVLPFSVSALPQLLARYAAQVRGAQLLSEVTAPAGEPQILSPAELGGRLFQALFPGPVRSLFDQSLGILGDDPDWGLRLAIQVDPRHPAVAPLQQIPWEFLYHADTEQFLSLGRRSPVVRSLDVPRPQRALLDDGSPWRILAFASNVPGRDVLDLDTELRQLTAALAGRRDVEIVPLKNADRSILRAQLLERRTRTPFNILHVMGHGDFDPVSGEGVLLLREGDRARAVTGPELAEDLRDFTELRLIVLNACRTARAAGAEGLSPFAGVATALVLNGVPAVVAMQFEISDPAAVEFSTALYQKLAEQDAIEAAVAEARLAVRQKIAGTWQWGTPVLFQRSRDEDDREPRASRWRRWALLLLFLIALILAPLVSRVPDWLPKTAAQQSRDKVMEGVQFAQAGNLQEARLAFLDAAGLDPKNAEPHARLSRLEARRGNHRDALKHANSSLALEPANHVYLTDVAGAEARLGQHDAAFAHLREALRHAPAYAPANSELGRLYLLTGRLPEARRHLEQGLAADASLPALHRNLGWVALFEKNATDAGERFEEALRYKDSEPDLENAETMLGLAWVDMVRFQLGETCQKIASYRELDPHGLGPMDPMAKQLELGCQMFPQAVPQGPFERVFFEYFRQQMINSPDYPFK